MLGSPGEVRTDGSESSLEKRGVYSAFIPQSEALFLPVGKEQAQTPGHGVPIQSLQISLVQFKLAN